MGWIVAVAPPQEAVSATDVRALLQACTEALPEGDACVIAGPHRGVDWRAVARCTDERCSSATVMLDAPDGPRERTLGFASGDPASERFRALGFAIAALVPPHPAPAVRSVAPASPPASSPIASVSTPLVPPSPDAPRIMLSLGAAITTGVGGRLFPGAEARGAVRVRSVEVGVAGGGTVERSEGARQESALSWIAAGVRLPVWSSVRGRAFARGEGLADRVHLERYDADGVAHSFRWSFGVRLGLDAEIVATDRSFVLAFAGLAARGTGRHAGRDQAAGELETLRVDAGLGFGTRF